MLVDLVAGKEPKSLGLLVSGAGSVDVDVDVDALGAVSAVVPEPTAELAPASSPAAPASAPAFTLSDDFLRTGERDLSFVFFLDLLLLSTGGASLQMESTEPSSCAPPAAEGLGFVVPLPVVSAAALPPSLCSRSVSLLWPLVPLLLSCG